MTSAPDEEYQVEQSPSGDTVMVRGRKSMTVLLRGHLVRHLEHIAQAKGVSVSALLEEILEKQFGAGSDTDQCPG